MRVADLVDSSLLLDVLDLGGRRIGAGSSYMGFRSSFGEISTVENGLEVTLQSLGLQEVLRHGVWSEGKAGRQLRGRR